VVSLLRVNLNSWEQGSTNGDLDSFFKLLLECYLFLKSSYN
jgi:hypothetical protein